ncbi:YbjN domain-containing protein [Actinacidiphila acidipaludis]|uniref:YbjN domain-containing protein n=1 Tax=Actinacidiphila acidipaludis TaxID=2873382 RepID=A0ABS7QES4_9ACTN|nr:YbjN domain-containing protein [Streptomyces acidipaludis]MBY8880920.1 YbjN domain-containing protein [Streptomyces acidipaludis]
MAEHPHDERATAGPKAAAADSAPDRPDAPAVDAAPAGPAGADSERTRAAAEAAEAVERALSEAELSWESPRPGTYVTQLPGTRKLSTTCQLIVGRHTLSLNAFVVRRPDENHEAFYRWLLERNLRLYGVSYAIDRLGDVYLNGRLPLAAVSAEEVDRLLGQVAEHADGSFNVLLELGFASSIRKEYAWRVSRGESTRNLDAFTHLTQDLAE